MWVYIVTKKIGELDTRVLGYRCYKTPHEALQAIFDDHSNWHRFAPATIDERAGTFGGPREVLATTSFGTKIVYKIEGMLIE